MTGLGSTLLSTWLTHRKHRITFLPLFFLSLLLFPLTPHENVATMKKKLHLIPTESFYFWNNYLWIVPSRFSLFSLFLKSFQMDLKNGHHPNGREGPHMCAQNKTPLDQDLPTLRKGETRSVWARGLCLLRHRIEMEDVSLSLSMLLWSVCSVEGCLSLCH